MMAMARSSLCSRRSRTWLAACAVAVASMASTPPAHAAFGVANFDGQVTTDAAGTPFTQAGGHPYALATQISFNTVPKVLPVFGSVQWPEEPVKDVIVDAPVGFMGNPTATPKCTMRQLAIDPDTDKAPDGSQAFGPLCPSASQIGVVQVEQALPFSLLAGFPLFNMVPPPDVPAEFAFSVGGTIITLDGELRSGSDYGVSINVRNASEAIAIRATRVTLWGVPSDPSHDPERACPGESAPEALGDIGPFCATDAPRLPFLRMPTSCPPNPTTGLETKLRTDSWWHPGQFVTASFRSHLPPGLPDGPFPGLPSDQWGPEQGVTGCADVPFDPSFTVTPANPASPGASGYAFDLTLPQNDDPDLPGTSDLRKATVTLPAGVRVNPSSAQGLGACSPAQIALKSSAVATCPDSSKIGTLRIDTPLLDKPLEGAVYLATPHDNPSHSLLAVYLVAKGPGLIVKLAGGVAPDAKTGRLSATFDNQPQVPFSNLHLEFFGGDHAPLSNPATCGTYTTRAVLTSWSGKTVVSDSSFTTSHDGKGAPCPGPRFQPSLLAETLTPVAGRYTPLSVTISRSDDDEEIAGVDSIQMPDGLLGKIKGVTLCAGAQARAGSCGAASRIGSVTAAAGNGPEPFPVSGSVYLGSRYKGAPFSLVFEVPVVAGPFDLGQITVRSALFVDRHNATLRVVTDPLPTILDGIPLQVRLVNVTVDRKQFILNPTSCAVKQVSGAIRSVAGSVAQVGNRFQVGECASLGFHPRMSIRVGGSGHTKKGSSTPLKTVLTMPGGGANLKSVGVRLPLSLNALLPVVNNACTQAEFEAGHCEQARAGKATAITPLLAHGLRGGVYFVKDPDKPAGSLPNLVVALRGQVDFDLIGRIKIPGGEALATRFTTVPDVPVKKFVLSLVSGSRGPLGVAENLCSPGARSKTASIVYRGQNGVVLRERQRLHVAGCKKGVGR
jgi:hypothetical protein